MIFTHKIRSRTQDSWSKFYKLISNTACLSNISSRLHKKKGGTTRNPAPDWTVCAINSHLQQINDQHRNCSTTQHCLIQVKPRAQGPSPPLPNSTVSTVTHTWPGGFHLLLKAQSQQTGQVFSGHAKFFFFHLSFQQSCMSLHFIGANAASLLLTLSAGALSAPPPVQFLLPEIP